MQEIRATARVSDRKQMRSKEELYLVLLSPTKWNGANDGERYDAHGGGGEYDDGGRGDEDE